MAKRRDVTAHVRQTLQPYFTNKLPPRFGCAAREMVVERLRAADAEEEGVADEVLLRGCDLTVSYLRNGGSAGHPERLFQALSCSVVERVLNDRAASEMEEIMRLLGGEIALEQSPLRDNSVVFERVREAIELLPDRLKHFMRLDFLEAKSPQEIRLELDLADHEAYLHLKRVSLKALRQAIERLISAKPLRVVS